MMYLLFMAPAILLSLWAQFRVKSTFSKFSKVPTRGGMTGADIARMLLRARGVHDVTVERTGGYLSDHYDPSARVLRLSEATYDSRSVAAIGVAAHEAGHAFQHAENYPALHFRSSIVPVLSLGSRVLPFLVLLAIFSGAIQTGGLLAWLVVAVLAMIVVFSLVTLPVEFDASKRALAVLDHGGILEADELVSAKKVLDAAALTYVAAAIAAISELSYWLMMLLGNQRGED